MDRGDCRSTRQAHAPGHRQAWLTAPWLKACRTHLRHEAAIHADEVHRQRVTDELLLNHNGLRHNLSNPLLAKLVVEQAAQQSKKKD